MVDEGRPINNQAGHTSTLWAESGFVIWIEAGQDLCLGSSSQLPSFSQSIGLKGQ